MNLLACLTCGAPAVSFCRDAYEIKPVNGTQAYVLGYLKAGCTAHPVESIIYDQTGAVDLEEMESQRRLREATL